MIAAVCCYLEQCQVPVQKQVMIPHIQTIQKQVEVPQMEYVDEEVEAREARARAVPNESTKATRLPQHSLDALQCFEGARAKVPTCAPGGKLRIGHSVSSLDRSSR